MVAEVNWLSTMPGGVNFDVLVGTVPMGAGVFLMALKLPDLAIARPIAHLGKYSLGMFASHLAIMFEVQRLVNGTAFTSEFVVVALTVVSAAVLAVVFGQFRLVRPILQ